jgi:hypothetical protein
MTSAGIPITTNRGKPGVLYVGMDNRGIELEVITVPYQGGEKAIHSMPTGERHVRRNR